METHELFENVITYPDPDMKDRLDLLVGLDDYKNQISKLLGILINPDGIRKWQAKYHPEATQAIDYILRRPPLLVLEGDVGCGKTELATTIGDRVARQEKINLTLLPLSLMTRGRGLVGEMTQLLSKAFEDTIERAKKLKSSSGGARGAVILLIDEADSLSTSRNSSQMHHEDKVGVNTVIRGLDQMGNARLPTAVIMCTNRIGALDPAVKRRAAEIFRFDRPDELQRRTALEKPLKSLGLNKKAIDQVVKITGIKPDQEFGFTYSDLTQRLLPAIVLNAYPGSGVNSKRALEVAHAILPTPPFLEKLVE